MAFVKATKKQSRLRMAIDGPSGSGKTYTALKVGRYIAGPDGKLAVIDSERGSASKYADVFNFDTDPEPMKSFSPDEYVRRIHEAEQAGYDVLIIDSLTHAWSGKEGALEQVDKAAARLRSSNSFTAWREVTPMHNALVDAILMSSCHIIVTMRSKTEYVLEDDERGKKVPRKIGMAPIQRDGMEYEFDIVGDMDADNKMIVSKSRCPALNRAVIPKPGDEFAATVKSWLTDGAPMPVAPPPQPPAPVSAKLRAARSIKEWAAMPDIDDKALVLSVLKTVGIDTTQKLTDEQWEAVCTFVQGKRDAGEDFVQVTNPKTQEAA